MDFEEEDLFGDFPYTPQWEVVQQKLIEESTEVESVHEETNNQSDFFRDFADGFI